jgi:hypothetical protein
MAALLCPPSGTSLLWRPDTCLSADRAIGIPNTIIKPERILCGITPDIDRDRLCRSEPASRQAGRPVSRYASGQVKPGLKNEMPFF